MPSSESLLFVTGTILVMGCVFAIWWAGVSLSSTYGSDVRIVWYIFFLTITATGLVSIWARGAGAMGERGNFQGVAGETLKSILYAFLDFDAGLKFYASLVVLAIAPQAGSWLFSGLVGCAKSPIFVGPVFRFFFWSVVKTFVVGSGIVLFVAVYGFSNSWEGITLKRASGLVMTAMILMTSSFGMIYFYRTSGEAFKPIMESAIHSKKGGNLLGRLTAWMNRNIE